MTGAFAVAAVAVWGGLCAADQRAIGGRQLHQPIVAAVGAGWLLGDPDRGLLVGLWMQLVWAVPMPLGGRLLPDTGSAAVAAAVLAVLIPGPVGLLAALLLGLLVAWATIPWERALRKANEMRESSALKAPWRDLRRGVFLGVLGPGLRGLLLAASAYLIGSVAGAALGREHLATTDHLATLQPALIGGAACVGLAVLVLHFRSEVGGMGLRWIAGGALLGVVARLLGLVGSP